MPKPPPPSLVLGRPETRDAYFFSVTVASARKNEGGAAPHPPSPARRANAESARSRPPVFSPRAARARADARRARRLSVTPPSPRSPQLSLARWTRARQPRRSLRRALCQGGPTPGGSRRSPRERARSGQHRATGGILRVELGHEEEGKAPKKRREEKTETSSAPRQAVEAWTSQGEQDPQNRVRARGASARRSWAKRIDASR